MCLDWHALLLPIRRAAVALAQAGRLVIYRKGKPADPDDFQHRDDPLGRPSTSSALRATETSESMALRACTNRSRPRIVTICREGGTSVCTPSLPTASPLQIGKALREAVDLRGGGRRGSLHIDRSAGGTFRLINTLTHGIGLTHRHSVSKHPAEPHSANTGIPEMWVEGPSSSLHKNIFYF